MGGVRVSLTVLYGPRYLAPIRYLAITFWTLLVLFVRAPDVVCAQNPPVFCPLVCLLYARMSRRKLVVGQHSIWSVKTLGRGPISALIGWLETFVARSANANTAPQSAWGKRLTQMQARHVVVLLYMQLNSDTRLLLTKDTSSLRLLVPPLAIVSLSLLFSQDNNIPLLTYAFSRKALGAISVGHIVLGAILGVVQGYSSLLH